MSATPASMLHIVASGLQDRERLNSPIGSPSTQFYKSVMRRRTRWASQWRRVDFDNLADFGRTAVVTFPINGELISRATLVVVLPDIYTPQITAHNQQYDVNHGSNRVVAPSWAWTNGLGHAICSDVQMLIGDAIIDEFDSRHLEVLDEQTRPVEHFDSTNLLIARDPSTYTDQQMLQLYQTGTIAVPQTNPQTLEVVFPFWWNRGPGPQALPIQALWKDTVQIKCSFRPVQECVYTSTRIDPRNPPLSANQGVGPMPNITGCSFFIQDPSGQPIYNAASTDDLSNTTGGLNPFMGSVLASPTMPTAYHFTDAYWIVEYISLEDREASAYRMADLEIPIEQHIALPVITTGGATDLRIRMDHGGLVRDLTWVAQRVEAPTYNAYFLFSRDLGPLGKPGPVNPAANPCDIPWWPDALIPNWDYGDGYIRPGFADRRSDPIAAAKMMIRALPRFEHEGPSMFRSLIPVLNCMRTPLIDRYIYRYDFGFWPTGGLAEALYLPADEIRGCANWDKLPKRELALTMNTDSCSTLTSWVPIGIVTTITGDTFQSLDALFPNGPDGLQVTLVGAQPNLGTGAPDLLGNNGQGATVEGVIDWANLRRMQSYVGLWVRTNANGSASIVMQTTAGYTWVAVAGAGGSGQVALNSGGYAGSAVEIGWQGGNYLQSHSPVDISGGAIIYSSYGLTNLDLPGIAFVSPVFTIIYPGLDIDIEMSFSVTTTPIIITLSVNGGPPYTFTSPTTPNPIVETYNLYASSVINVLPGDSIVVTMTSVAPFIAATNGGALSCRVFIRDSSVPIGDVIYGGGGGLDGPGLPDGSQMLTTTAFVTGHQMTGGSGHAYAGGDGYYGGGSGDFCGGGGGSYVSGFITQVSTTENSTPTPLPVSASVIPLTLTVLPPPNFNIYSWITRYNRLRINSGRGGLMFNETA